MVNDINGIMDLYNQQLQNPPPAPEYIPEPEPQQGFDMGALVDILAGMGSGAGESFAGSLGRSTRSYEDRKLKSLEKRQQSEADRINKMLGLYEKDRESKLKSRELDIREKAANRQSAGSRPSPDMQLINYFTNTLKMSPQDAINKVSDFKDKGIDSGKIILGLAGDIATQGYEPVGAEKSIKQAKAMYELAYPPKETLQTNTSGNTGNGNTGEVLPDLEKLGNPLDKYVDDLYN